MRQLAAPALTLAALFLSVNLIRAATCVSEEDCANQINQQNSTLTTIQQQQADLQRQLDAAKKGLNSTAAQLASIQKQVNDIQDQLTKADQDLQGAQAILDKNKELFRIRVRDLYIKGSISGWELLFGDSYSFADAAQFAGLKQVVIDHNKQLIIEYTSTVKNLSDTKNQIAAQAKTAQDQLAQIQAIKNAQAAQVASFQRTQSAYQSQLSDITKNLNNLSVQQQAIIAAKLAASAQNQSVGDVALGNYTLPTAPFGNAWVFLTYGYPHRVGMNQYGAYGRAKQGQDYQTILNAYFANIQIGPYSEPSTIPVQGYGTISFEDNYLKGIGEMPTDWGSPSNGGMEALKAQAVAARTYALNWLNAHPGQSICTDQNCQVYIGSDKGSYWDQAVDATRGIVITYGGAPITAWYASTAGGYTRTSQDVWGGYTAYTKRVRDYDGNGQPYDVLSPWYHKAWGDAGNGTPWLTEAQTEDLFNAAILYHATQSTQGSDYNLTQPDKGGSTPQQILDALSARGLAPIGAISSIGMHNDGSGYIDTVTVNGSRVFDGYEFRSVFNLRSVGTLAIWTSLYDVKHQP